MFKKWIKLAVFALMGGFIGGCVTFIVFKQLPYIPEKYGSLADWVSGIGSIGSILFVWKQMKQDQIRYDDSYKPNLEVHTTERRMVLQIQNITQVTKVIELAIYGTNTGKVAGYYKFMGICDSVDYNDAIKLGIGMDSLKREGKLIDLDPMYDMGAAERPFEKVSPFEMTSTVAFPIKTIMKRFHSTNLRVVFVDASMNPNSISITLES